MIDTKGDRQTHENEKVNIGEYYVEKNANVQKPK